MSQDDQVHELTEILDSEHTTRATIRDLPERFGEDVRAAVVERVAQQFSPPPSGPLLAGLELIATDATRPAIVQTYLANLRSPDPDARQASLDGLARLGYPHIEDVAKAALRDDYDPVVAGAVRILVPLADRDPALRALLTGVRAQHADDPSFHLTTSLLAAHAIGEGP